jgi:G3E family GTPase
MRLKLETFSAVKHFNLFTRENIKQLVFITGFLGSGKTTFLYETILRPENSKTAVVVNDEGRFVVESQKTKKTAKRYATDVCRFTVDTALEMSLRESVNFGVNASFFKAVNSLFGLKCQYVFIETMGMIQPDALTRLVNKIRQLSGERLNYKGTICIIDTLRFFNLFPAVASIYKQAACADIFVLSKTDLAEKGNVEKITGILKTIRPPAPVLIGDGSQTSLASVLSAVEASVVTGPGFSPNLLGSGEKLTFPLAEAARV